MKVKEFKEYLIANNVPDDAEIVIWADHAQDYERVDDVWITKSNDGHFESLIWEFDGYEDVYDNDAVEEYPVGGDVTAVCLNGAVC